VLVVTLLVLGSIATLGLMAASVALAKIDLLEGKVSHLRDVCRYLAERRGPR
jgi:hypothetical protein